MKKFYYLSDLGSIQLDEKNQAWIEVFRLGKWKHPRHGWIEGTTKMFESFINNWKENILGRDVSFDKNHTPSEGATAWLKDLRIVGDRLKALVEFTPWGKELINEKGFKYFSPEYVDKYEQKEPPNKTFGPTMLGGAITNRPFLTGLEPITLSEDLEESLQGCMFTEKTIDFDKVLEDSIKEVADMSDMSVEEMKELLST